MACPFRGGPYYAFSFPSGGKLRTELYIDFGDGDDNMALFKALARYRNEIEATVGAELSWEDLPDRRACRIAAYGDGQVTNADRFDGYIDWFFETGAKLRSAMSAAAARIEADARMPESTPDVAG